MSSQEEIVELHYRTEDIPQWFPTFPVEEGSTEEDDKAHTDNYHNYVASVGESDDPDIAINSYRGITEKDALEIVSGHVDGEPEDVRSLVCKFTLDQATKIRRDMRKMIRDGHIGSTYSGFKRFTQAQIDLLHNLNMLYYDLESPFAINNSATGTGKSLMGLAQGLMSRCPNIVIVGPASSESAWRDAVTVLPEIKFVLDEQFGTNHPWPDNIWYASSEQLRNEKGVLRPMLQNYPKIHVLSKHKVISTRFKNRSKDPVVYDVFALTGSSYEYGPNDEITRPGKRSRAPPDTYTHVDDNGNLINEDGILIDENGKYINKQGRRVKNPVKGVIDRTYRDFAHPEGTARRLIEEGLFYIYDEFHGSKNDSMTSKAVGAIPAEIVASRGGIKDITLIADHTPLIRGRHRTYIPYRGHPFADGAVTGRSRILLMSATVSDRERVYSIGRTLGLYMGEGRSRDYISVSTGQSVTDIQFLVDTINNLGFYLTAIENNLTRLDIHNGNEVIEELSTDPETGEPIILVTDNTLPRPQIMKYLDTFRSTYLHRGRTQIESDAPDLESIIRSILSDSFFVQAIAYDGKMTQEMNDLIISLDGRQSEVEMIELVQQASKFFISKDVRGKDKVAGSAMSALVEIENRLIPHAINQIIELLENNPTHRCVIGLNYNSGIAHVFNAIQQHHLRRLNIIAPLLLTGKTSKASRPYLNALFQHDLNYRLLIANVRVIKQSISLHPLYPDRFTTIIVPIPQNAVDYYQIAGRVLRHGAEANSQFLVISPGVRHSYQFYNIDVAMRLAGLIAGKSGMTRTDANDVIVQIIIDIHKILRQEYPQWSIDLIHQVHTWSNKTVVEQPFKDVMYDILAERAYNNEIDDETDKLLRHAVQAITRRYKAVSNEFRVSLINLIRKRNEKTGYLQSVTSEQRELPKSSGYIEKALVAAYTTSGDEESMIRDALRLEREEEPIPRRADADVSEEEE